MEKVAQAGKGAYVWRTLDAELAALAFDSDRAETGAARGGGGHPDTDLRKREPRRGARRGGGSLVGQLVPAGAYRMALHRIGRDPVGVPVDDLGCFSIEPLRAAPSAFAS